MDERHRLGGGEVDRDIRRVQVEADDDHIGIGQQVEEALDEEDRDGDPEPVAEVDGALFGRIVPADAGDHENELADRGEVDRGKRCNHGRMRCGRMAEFHRACHKDEDEKRTDDVGRHQGSERPAIGATHSLLYVAECHHGQGKDRQKERHDIVGFDPVAEKVQGNQSRDAHGGCHRHGKQPRGRG